MQKKNLFLALGLGALALVGTVGASAKLLSKDAIPAYGALEKEIGRASCRERV